MKHKTVASTFSNESIFEENQFRSCCFFRILQAKRSSKKEAQFFFSPETISVFLDIIKKRGFCSVLCLGTPTIHEAIKNQLKKCESILMDFDERLSQFFPNNEFCHYNMFNHFFFKSKETYLNFLQASSTGGAYLNCCNKCTDN